MRYTILWTIALAGFVACGVVVEATSAEQSPTAGAAQKLGLDLKSIERDRVLKAANDALTHEPVTVTAEKCPRSAGDAHDFYSEGDYWWPNPKDPTVRTFSATG